MRQVAVDARDKNNRAEWFKVVTTILDATIDGRQIGELYERRWYREKFIRLGAQLGTSGGGCPPPVFSLETLGRSKPFTPPCSQTAHRWVESKG
jgi:hypothetical protein